MKITIIIAGSRNFNDYEFIKYHCDQLLSNLKERFEIKIISGGAKGVDNLAKRYALENNYEFQEYPANWDKFAKSAGTIRNIEMAKAADRLIAFWNGSSRGTEHMIREAKRRNLKVKVINI